MFTTFQIVGDSAFQSQISIYSSISHVLNVSSVSYAAINLAHRQKVFQKSYTILLRFQVCLYRRDQFFGMALRSSWKVKLSPFNSTSDSVGNVVNTPSKKTNPNSEHRDKAEMHNTF